MPKRDKKYCNDDESFSSEKSTSDSDCDNNGSSYHCKPNKKCNITTKNCSRDNSCKKKNVKNNNEI